MATPELRNDTTGVFGQGFVRFRCLPSQWCFVKLPNLFAMLTLPPSFCPLFRYNCFVPKDPAPIMSILKEANLI